MKNLTKQEISKRILKDGKPLSLDLFSYDAKTKIISTDEDCLVFNFKDLHEYRIL